MGLFNRFGKQAKQMIDKRGGVKSLEEDAKELKDVATGEGSVTDKAKEAIEAIKDPGAPGDDAAKPASSDPAAPAQ